MEKGLEPGNNRQCDINLVLEESEPEKGNKTETNFSVWSNREQASGGLTIRWLRGVGHITVIASLSRGPQPFQNLVRLDIFCIV